MQYLIIVKNVSLCLVITFGNFGNYFVFCKLLFYDSLLSGMDYRTKYIR